MKLIILVHHNKQTDDRIKVYSYSKENFDRVKLEMERHWKGGKWAWFGDRPCENGEQFGLDEDYYSSYSIVCVSE